MGIKDHGTVSVPSAGLAIRFETIQTVSDVVRLVVIRHGVHLKADLSKDEATALFESLMHALDDLKLHAAGVAP